MLLVILVQKNFVATSKILESGAAYSIGTAKKQINPCVQLLKTLENILIAITEVTTDTTDRNDWPIVVGGIGNYAAAWSMVSTETDRELLLRK